MVKTIDSIQYHVWSDALHARELARRTQSEWDRGAYVRWAIQTAWSAFEAVCADAVQATGLGMRFKDGLNEAVEAKGLRPIEWGHGIWQEVLQVYKLRKTFVHVIPRISHQKLLSPVMEAERAITILRKAIKAILDLVGLPHPAWINDDVDRGWQGEGAIETSSHATLIRADVDENSSEAIRVTYILHGKEHVSETAPPSTSYTALLDQLLGSLNVPVDAVRAYRGSNLLEERRPNLR